MGDDTPMIRCEYSRDSDALYIYLAWRPDERVGVVAYTVGCESPGVEMQVDFTKDHSVFGVEILDAMSILPPPIVEAFSTDGVLSIERHGPGSVFPTAFLVSRTDCFRLVFAEAGLPDSSQVLARRLCSTSDDDGRHVSLGFVDGLLVMLEVAQAERLVPASARQAATIWPVGRG